MLTLGVTGETRVLVEAVLGAIRQPLSYRRSNGGYTCAHCLGFRIAIAGGKAIK
jgi:hypothetical protein